MKRKYYRKLIRDRIPAKIAESGGDCETYRLGRKEFERELLAKVAEEATGLVSARNRKELLAELADVKAVLDEILRLKRITPRELAAEMRRNFARKGGFRKKLFLVWSSDNGYKTNERTLRRRN